MYVYTSFYKYNLNNCNCNFYVWTNEYSKYQKTDKSQRLLESIRDRVRNLLLSSDLDVDLNFDYDNNIRYKPIPEGWDDERNS